MKTGSPKKVLVAVRPEVRETARLLLEPDFIPTYCDTLQDAIELLNAGKYDLIFCTIRFDESRMFELIKYIKCNASANISQTPFIAVRPTGGIFSDQLVDGILKASKLMGADEAVNLPEWEHEFGHARANARLHDKLHDMGYPCAARIPV